MDLKSCGPTLCVFQMYHRLLSNSLENCPVGHVISGVVVKTGSNVEKYEEDMCVVGEIQVSIYFVSNQKFFKKTF